MPIDDYGVELAEEDESVEFAELPSEDAVSAGDIERFHQAVVHATDWTTETIVSQLRRGNFVLNPSFQRRDAWKTQQKSRFIESLILGLPIPQIVLAESKTQRGKFIVLDGKQRLLSILQFWGFGEGSKNRYALSGLEIRTDLVQKRLSDLESDSSLEGDYNALLNQPIRTVVIKNWPDQDFLHLVFLRLNTGSVRLSPQELRQALYPGEFSTWVDEAAGKSLGIKRLLKLKEPDYRMRDIEVLARYLAFRFFLEEYKGRMKHFLDTTFERFNANWGTWSVKTNDALSDFEDAVDVLMKVFGDAVGKKPGSRLFNRAVFDFMVFYAQHGPIREAMLAKGKSVKKAFDKLFEDPEFKSATERDTAGVPNTVLRLAKWGEALSNATGMKLPIPKVLEQEGGHRVQFSGF